MTVPEVTLRFLGAATVLRGTTALSGRAVQRRRVALLGLLATAPERTASRDRLIGLLWPEAGTTAARDLLNTAVYELRQALGDEAIQSLGDELRLNPAVVQSDVTAFESAIAAGDYEAAVGLYRGPFLDGLFVTGAPEFEHWLDGARERVRRLHRQALRRLAATASTRTSAADALARLAEEDPADGEAVRDAVQVMSEVGNLGGARRLAERHIALTQDIGPDATVMAFMQTHQAEPAAEADARTADTASAGPRAKARVSGLRLALGLSGAATLALVLLGFRLLASPAARHFAAGERDYRAGRYLAAVEHYRQAARHDSSVALAFYRLSQSIIAADLPENEAAAAESVALRLSPALPERDRLLLRGWASFRLAHPNIAEEIYRSLATLYPSDVEAWYQLAETQFHYNARSGRSILEARPAFERVVALDGRHWGARWHLAHLYAAAGDRAAYARALGTLLDERPEAALALEIRALRAIALRDGALDSILPQLAATDHLRLFQIAWRSAVYLQDIDAAERVLRQLAGGPFPAALGRGMQVYLAVARGRWHEAEARLALMPPTEAPSIIEARLVAAAHPLAPARTGALDSLRAAIGRLADASDLLPTLLRGYEAALRGDGARVDAMVRRLRELGATDEPFSVEALRAYRAGNFARAAQLSVGLADTVPWFGWAVTSPLRAGVLDRWAHAEALRQLGRDSAALGWYGSFGEHGLPDVAYLAPARLRRGEIFERRGRAAEAVREYEAFVGLWREADADLQPLVADVRRRIERLSRPRPAE